jgi:hypothetical protein
MGQVELRSRLWSTRVGQKDETTMIVIIIIIIIIIRVWRTMK